MKKIVLVTSPTAEHSIYVQKKEIKFIKRVAGNDPLLSANELKRLGKWLQLRSNSSNPFSDQDIVRLWKSLFLCICVSDNLLIQERLADNFASLLHCFDKKSDSIRFYGGFFKVLGEEWFGIEPWRIDRFMMLVRRVTRQCFVILHGCKWNEKLINKLNEYVEDSIFDRSISIKFLMFFAEIYLGELAKATDGKISRSKVTLLIHPFAMCLAIQRDEEIVRHTIKHIFDALLYHRYSGKTYTNNKYEAWTYPGTSMDDLELVPEEDNEIKPDGQDGVEQCNKTVSSALDLRAGRVIVEIPFDPEEIIKKLEHFKHASYTGVKGRRMLRMVIDRYSRFTTAKVEEKVFSVSEGEIKKLNKKKRKIMLPNPGKQPKKIKLSTVEVLKMKKKKFLNSWTETDLTPEEVSMDESNYSCQVLINGNTSTDPDKQNATTVYDSSNSTLQEPEAEYFNAKKDKRKQRVNDANAKWFEFDESQSVHNLHPISVVDNKQNTKKVTIKLELNRSQEMTEYFMQLQIAPKIPYDSKALPGKGLLKPNLKPSLIDPDYITLHIYRCRNLVGLVELSITLQRACEVRNFKYSEPRNCYSACRINHHINLLNKVDADSRVDITIDSLPFELIEIVLKHLDIKSLVKCCVVSKKWKFIIEQLNIQELQIENKCCIPGRFFLTGNRVDAKNIAENLDASQIGTFRLNLSNLKRLMINSKWDKKISNGTFDTTIVTMTPLYIKVQDLNKFTQLEQLKLDGITVDGQENRILHLPKLKILDFWHPNDTIVMDLPCLKVLNCHNLKRVHLVNPKTVDFIKVCSIEDGDTSVFADYENVAFLKLDNVLDVCVNNDILRNLPNLVIFDGDEEIKCKSKYELVKNLYNLLRKQKQSSMRHRGTLRLCFGQIEIENNKRFEDYEAFRDYFDW